MKTKKFGNLEITKVLHKGKCFNDIKIPNGFKLLTMQDVADIRNNPEVIKWVDGHHLKSYPLKNPHREPCRPSISPLDKRCGLCLKRFPRLNIIKDGSGVYYCENCMNKIWITRGVKPSQFSK